MELYQLESNVGMAYICAGGRVRYPSHYWESVTQQSPNVQSDFFTLYNMCDSCTHWLHSHAGAVQGATHQGRDTKLVACWKVQHRI